MFSNWAGIPALGQDLTQFSPGNEFSVLLCLPHIFAMRILICQTLIKGFQFPFVFAEHFEKLLFDIEKMHSWARISLNVNFCDYDHRL